MIFYSLKLLRIVLNSSRLYRASSLMNQQLLEASEMQNAMLESQKQGLKLQNELLHHGEQLGTVIKSSAETVNSMVSDFR